MSKGDYDFLNRVIVRSILASPPSPVRIYSGGPIPRVNRMSSKGISTSGMEGFSEEGAPGDWDMAIGEVYGYRWWKMHIPAELAGVYIENRSPYVSPAGLYPLTGANGHNWGPGRLEATCPRNAYSAMGPAYRAVVHEPPEYREACGCGFWAYFNPRLDVTQVFSGLSTQNPYRVGNDVHLPILGVVKGTGRVIIGTKGFRSQYAEIMGLCVPDVAKTQLHWNIEPRASYEKYGWTDIYTALRGGSPRTPWYSNHYPDGVVKQADEAERLKRYAAVEAMLSVSYPKAYVLSDENALRSYFGADKNYYHPPHREHPPFW